jgi:serine/threonine protein kinase
MTTPLPCPTGSFAELGAAGCTPCSSTTDADVLQCSQQFSSSPLEMDVIISLCVAVDVFSSIMMFRRVLKSSKSRFEAARWAALALVFGPVVWGIYWFYKKQQRMTSVGYVPQKDGRSHYISRSDLESKFEKLKKIGSGSFGIVWLVQERNGRGTGIMYALKEIDLRKPGLSQVTKEVETMMKLPPHRNIVRLWDHWVSDDVKDLWLLLDYCSEGTLVQFLYRTYQLPDEALLDVCAQLLQALNVFEQHHILHNDIKPENIFIGQDRVPKIGDLGMARFTSVGSVLAKVPGCTPVFSSPEVLSKQLGPDGKPSCFPEYATCEISYQSDVYSLGVVMWSMIMRRNPDQPGGATQFAAARVANAKLRGLVNDMLQPNPALRPRASELVKRC